MSWWPFLSSCWIVCEDGCRLLLSGLCSWICFFVCLFLEVTRVQRVNEVLLFFPYLPVPLTKASMSVDKALHHVPKLKYLRPCGHDDPPSRFLVGIGILKCLIISVTFYDVSFQWWAKFPDFSVFLDLFKGFWLFFFFHYWLFCNVCKSLITSAVFLMVRGIFVSSFSRTTCMFASIFCFISSLFIAHWEEMYDRNRVNGELPFCGWAGAGVVAVCSSSTGHSLTVFPFTFKVLCYFLSCSVIFKVLCYF